MITQSENNTESKLTAQWIHFSFLKRTNRWRTKKLSFLYGHSRLEDRWRGANPIHTALFMKYSKFVPGLQTFARQKISHSISCKFNIQDIIEMHSNSRGPEREEATQGEVLKSFRTIFLFSDWKKKVSTIGIDRSTLKYDVFPIQIFFQDFSSIHVQQTQNNKLLHFNSKFLERFCIRHVVNATDEWQKHFHHRCEKYGVTDVNTEWQGSRMGILHDKKEVTFLYFKENQQQWQVKIRIIACPYRVDFIRNW